MATPGKEPEKRPPLDADISRGQGHRVTHEAPTYPPESECRERSRMRERVHRDDVHFAGCPTSHEIVRGGELLENHHARARGTSAKHKTLNNRTTSSRSWMNTRHREVDTELAEDHPQPECPRVRGMKRLARPERRPELEASVDGVQRVRDAFSPHEDTDESNHDEHCAER